MDKNVKQSDATVEVREITEAIPAITFLVKGPYKCGKSTFLSWVDSPTSSGLVLQRSLHNEEMFVTTLLDWQLSCIYRTITGGTNVSKMWNFFPSMWPTIVETVPPLRTWSHHLRSYCLLCTSTSVIHMKDIQRVNFDPKINQKERVLFFLLKIIYLQ